MYHSICINLCYVVWSTIWLFIFVSSIVLEHSIRLEAGLKEHQDMVIPTNNMNSYKVVETKERYIDWVLNHLKTDAIEVSANNLMKIHEEGNKLLSTLGNTL